MTLLETVLAMSLLSVIALTGAQAVRMSWQAWDIQDQRADMLQHLGGVLTHITRLARSARGIVSVSGPTDTSGNLEITLPDDSVVKWYHDSVSGVVRYEIDGAGPGELLATGIDSLKFDCFQLDGVTPTTIVADIRMIRVTTAVTIPVQGTSFPLSTTIWIRKQRDGVAPTFTDFYANNSSGGAGWNNHTYVSGPPDGSFGYGGGSTWVEGKDFDTTGLSGPVGTVLVGILLKTDSLLDQDRIEIQIRNRQPADGPTHKYYQRPLVRFENSLDWFWVDVTDDYSGWTYDDIDAMRVRIETDDQGAGTATLYVDSVKIRIYEAAPQSTTFWMTNLGSFSEWGDRINAAGAPDGVYAYSRIFTLPSDDVDRQDYLYTGSWQDLGAIISVEMRTHFYMSATVVDDMFHAKLVSASDPSEQGDTPVPITAEQVKKDTLNDHVGVANAGTVLMDFTNIQNNWTWPDLNAQIVRLYMTATGVPEAEIYVDAVSIEVRYVPPSEAAVVLWEEL